MFGFKSHSFLFIIGCSSLVKVFQYWCQKTWQTQVYFLTEANFLRIWCKSKSDEREYHYLSLISFELHTILPDGIGKTMIRGKGGEIHDDDVFAAVANDDVVADYVDDGDNSWRVYLVRQNRRQLTVGRSYLSTTTNPSQPSRIINNVIIIVIITIIFTIIAEIEITTSTLQ